MKSLYLRIWLTVVATLVLFALVSSWVWQRHLDQERARFETAATERLAAWAELLQRSLPPSDAPAAQQAEALREWSLRLRVPMALDDAQGQRIAASPAFMRREADGMAAIAVPLDDGRTLWVVRRLLRRAGTGPGPGLGPISQTGPPMAGQDRPGFPGPGPGMMEPPGARMPLAPLLGMFGAMSAWGPVALLLLLLLAVAAGAYPVVRRLTRRLEALKQGVEAFGAGHLQQRVDEAGRDEVAAVAVTFNRAAERIESLVRSHQSLLANASHELRSPLARLKMAVAMSADAPAPQKQLLRQEIDTNIAELDALVEEVLLASRLDAARETPQDETIELLALAAEEAARVDAEAHGDSVEVTGNERLLRRALRNLLENARRYGGDDVAVEVKAMPGGGALVRVCDRGPGVPSAYRERIFEPFFRLPGHAEREGGVGLGLSLVRQIAQRHRGDVRCEPREGGGTCFVLSLPARRA